MNTFNAITSAVFDLVFGWFGEVSAWVDILFWSILGGIVALLVYKWVSNQKGIEKAKNDIKVHLLEIRLFQDDILGVLVSTVKILVKNLLYIGHNVVPMIVMFVPMMTILFQLEAHYCFAPVDPGSEQVLKVTLDRDVTDVSTASVGLVVPEGVALGPRVRTGDEVAWSLRAEAEGDHELTVRVGDQEVTKRLVVGGEHRKIPYMRTKGWEGFLYPGEEMLPSDAPVSDVRFAKGDIPERDLGWLPGGEVGILGTFFILSIAAGLALKGVFGVTL